MDKYKIKKASKFLSYVLRHKPEKANVKLDIEGWCPVNELLRNTYLTWDLIRNAVEQNDKKRFEFNEKGDKIRARQGHSVDVHLGYKEVVPPDMLYHGTASKYVDSIYKDGIRKMKRHAVHLSGDEETAKKVGSRHGKPAVIVIKSKEMHENGYKFYLTDNGVWLTDFVPERYISFTQRY
jgi:putative RNA 2'-phosphotransferase